MCISGCQSIAILCQFVFIHNITNFNVAKFMKEIILIKTGQCPMQALMPFTQ
jgi:hypothetical protein